MANLQLLQALEQLNNQVVTKWYEFYYNPDDETEIVDLEPYDELKTDTFDSWFGDAKLENKANPYFPAFAQRGDGSFATLWLLDDHDLSNAPVVFIGSEGDLRIIAPNYSSFMMVSAAGYDMYQLADFEAEGHDPWHEPFEPFLQWVQINLGWSVPDNIEAMIDAARAGFPDPMEFIKGL